MKFAFKRGCTQILFSAFSLFFAVMGAYVSDSPEAQAGVFSTPHFTSPGEFTLGLEPEMTLTSGAGMAVNGRFTEGLSDLLNATGIIGTGGGPRRFRVGGNVAFDFFPDIEGQPGIGIATQGLYVRVPGGGKFETTAMPYIHKSFMNGDAKTGSEVEPYFSFPFGFSIGEGGYKTISNVVVGSMFKASEKLHYVLEVGIAVNNTESYISGGIAYFH